VEVIMVGRKFELTEDTLSIIEEIGGHMPGGFFMYKAEEPEELIYANQPVFSIFGCADLEQFSDYFSYTPDLRGMLLEAEKRRLPMVFTARELHDRNMDMMIDQCVLEYKARQYGYDLRIHSLLYLIVIAVIRRWISGGFVPQNYNASIDPIFTLSSYIVHHIHEPLKVEDLADYCGLSYPWFARKFHEIYGMSCKEYIEKVRVRRVEHFLQFTDCSLEYIRSHTGYVDCSHLVRDFRKHRGMTPGQFRKSCRQDAPGKDTFLKSIDTQEKNG
jgi:AraC-like DNA-binding protein